MLIRRSSRLKSEDSWTWKTHPECYKINKLTVENSLSNKPVTLMCNNSHCLRAIFCICQHQLFSFVRLEWKSFSKAVVGGKARRKYKYFWSKFVFFLLFCFIFSSIPSSVKKSFLREKKTFFICASFTICCV